MPDYHHTIESYCIGSFNPVMSSVDQLKECLCTGRKVMKAVMATVPHLSIKVLIGL